jgi:hypothetical protein
VSGRLHTEATERVAVTAVVRAGSHRPGQRLRALLAGTAHSDRSHLPARAAESAETGELGDHEAWAEWRSMLAPLVGRAGDLRRARIVSMPLSRYTQWEYEVAHENIAAGERVRWLPRREASDL